MKSNKDFRGANLEEADLRGKYFVGEDFKGANLHAANLKCACLRSSNLHGANLKEANLRSADLEGANLQGASLLAADLRFADLRRANLWDADIWGANLQGANMNEAKHAPIILQLDATWDVFIHNYKMKIGCERHLFSKWRAFTDKEISEMSPFALKFWEWNKDVILSLLDLYEKKNSQFD